MHSYVSLPEGNHRSPQFLLLASQLRGPKAGQKTPQGMDYADSAVRSEWKDRATRRSAEGYLGYDRISDN